MKNTDDFTYDSNGCIRHQGWKLWPWPSFRMEAMTTQVHATAACTLRSVLSTDDAFCLLWKGQIPEGIMDHLERYPAILPEALMAAQRDPDRFLNLCDEAPFAAMILWSAETGRDRVMKADINALLTAAGIPCDRESIEVLSRIPASGCHPEIIRAMQKALRCPLRRRLLIRSEIIDAQLCELLRLPINDRKVQNALAAMIKEEAGDVSV